MSDADKLRNLRGAVELMIMDLEGYLAQSQPESFPFPVRTVIEKLRDAATRSQAQ